MELLGIILLIVIVRVLVEAIRETEDQIAICNALIRIEKKREQEEKEREQEEKEREAMRHDGGEGGEP